MDDREDELKNENVSEETPSNGVVNEGTPTDITIDTRGAEARAKASKAAIDFLLNKKKIAIILVGGFAFFILLIVLLMAFDSSGGTDYVYKESGCKNIKVTYDPYGEDEGYTMTMGVEEYVKVATYAYASDFIEDKRSLQPLYFSISVAIRTEAISNNCAVTYRDKDLKKIKNSLPNDDYVEHALELSNGVVLVDDNEDFVKMHVADYCWTGDNSEHYSFPKVADPMEIDKSDTDKNVKDYVLKNCECNKSSGVIEVDESELEDKDPCFTYWSEVVSSGDSDDSSSGSSADSSTGDEEEELIWYKEYLHQDYEDGYQVYGAYHLHMDKGYNYELSLRQFVNGDAFFRIINREDKSVSDTLAMGSRSSACGTSSDDANFITFLKGYETIGDYCYCGSDKNMLLATGDGGSVCSKNNTGTPTIGAGVTYYSLDVAKPLIEENGWDKYFVKKEHDGKMYYDMVIQQTCVPKDVIESIQTYAFEHDYAKAVVDAANKYNVELAQYQIDALASLSWHAGSNHVDKVVKAYADGGYEGLWDTMKSVKASKDGYKKRRKGEFALFVTGDYTDQGKFYDHRGVENYDDYNSEGVMNREAVCNLNMSSSGYMFPLPSDAKVSCTSVFGFRNINVPGATSNHQGLDLATNGGTPIYAAKDGEVIEARDGIVGQDASNSAGNWVKIKHDDGSSTAYMHMTNGSVKVSVGDHVEQGDQIGEVGSTGASSGNHLHFSVYEANGRAVDPYNYLDLSSVSNSSSCKGNG